MRPDLVEVVVLAPGPHALLHRDGPRPGRRLLAEEVGLERHHARDGEQQRSGRAGSGWPRARPCGPAPRRSRGRPCAARWRPWSAQPTGAALTGARSGHGRPPVRAWSCSCSSASRCGHGRRPSSTALRRSTPNSRTACDQIARHPLRAEAVGAPPQPPLGAQHQGGADGDPEQQPEQALEHGYRRRPPRQAAVGLVGPGGQGQALHHRAAHGQVGEPGGGVDGARRPTRPRGARCRSVPARRRSARRCAGARRPAARLSTPRASTVARRSRTVRSRDTTTAEQRRSGRSPRPRRRRGRRPRSRSWLVPPRPRCCVRPSARPRDARRRGSRVRSSADPRGRGAGTAGPPNPGVVVRVLVALPVPEGCRALVAGRRGGGAGPRPEAAPGRRPWPCPAPAYDRFDLGAVARYTVAWARLSWASGRPTNSTAWAAALATSRPMRVGQPDVLGRRDHQPPGDEPGVLARLEHPGQPVEAGVGVRAPDALDEGADDVVVLVARRSGGPWRRGPPRRRRGSTTGGPGPGRRPGRPPPRGR